MFDKLPLTDDTTPIQGIVVVHMICESQLEVNVKRSFLIKFVRNSSRTNSAGQSRVERTCYLLQALHISKPCRVGLGIIIYLSIYIPVPLQYLFHIYTKLCVI